MPAPPPELPADGIDRGVSEFGEVLGELISAAPGAIGAVFSDGFDDSIDAAYRPEVISMLDLCIAGAQVGQAMSRLARDAMIFGLGSPAVGIECEQAIMLTTILLEEYHLTVLLARRANLARALRCLDAASEQIRELLA